MNLRVLTEQHRCRTPFFPDWVIFLLLPLSLYLFFSLLAVYFWEDSEGFLFWHFFWHFCHNFWGVLTWLFLEITGSNFTQTITKVSNILNWWCMSQWARFGTSKFFFILLSFWDTAVCLHFWVKFKMAARGPKRVTSQVFWSFLLPKFFLAPYSS